MKLLSLDPWSSNTAVFGATAVENSCPQSHWYSKTLKNSCPRNHWHMKNTQKQLSAEPLALENTRKQLSLEPLALESTQKHLSAEPLAFENTRKQRPRSHWHPETAVIAAAGTRELLSSEIRAGENSCPRSYQGSENRFKKKNSESLFKTSLRYN